MIDSLFIRAMISTIVTVSEYEITFHLILQHIIMPGYDTKEASSQLQATMFVSIMKPWQIWNYWYCTEKALSYFYSHCSLCNIATSHLFLSFNMIMFIGYTLYGFSCKISWNTWKLTNTYKKVQTISSNIQKIISITLLGHLSLDSLVKSGKMQKEQLLVKFCRHSLTRLPSSFSHSTCQVCNSGASGDWSVFHG